jgi:hypothetical protein
VIIVFLYFLPFECTKELDKYHNFSSDVCKKSWSNLVKKKIHSRLGWKILKVVGNIDLEPKRIEGKYIKCRICTSHSAGWLLMHRMLTSPTMSYKHNGTLTPNLLPPPLPQLPAADIILIAF